jgi:membrane-bound metal-dependent hydrolase YbcI (DUF457 family)
MDPASHIALAHNLIRLRYSPSAATGIIPAAVLGALSPDIDVFLLPRGWDRYMVAHESGTHSIFGALVCAALAAGLARILWRRGRYGAMLAVAALGAISHVWFDLFSGATIRLWWPLSGTRVANLGAFAMADPWMVALCLGAAIAILSGRGKRQRNALIFTLILVLFTAAKTATRVEAMRVFRAHMPDGGELLVLPVWSSLTAWEVYGHEAGHLSQWIVDARAGSIERRMTIPVVGAPEADRAIVADSLAWETVRNFRRTHAFAFARTTQAGRAIRVMWSDLRYCRPSTGSAGEPECTIHAGGELVAPAIIPRLIVTIGNVTQSR